MLKAINLILISVFLTSLLYAQNEKAKEVAFYAEKDKNGYKLFRLSTVDEKPVVYFFDLKKIKLIKKYPVPEFEKEYSYLEAITGSKNLMLLTAFNMNNNLYELYTQKRSISEYNEQTITIYEIKNNTKKLIGTYNTFDKFSKSKYLKFVFINN